MLTIPSPQPESSPPTNVIIPVPSLSGKGSAPHSSPDVPLWPSPSISSRPQHSNYLLPYPRRAPSVPLSKNTFLLPFPTSNPKLQQHPIPLQQAPVPLQTRPAPTRPAPDLLVPGPPSDTPLQPTISEDAVMRHVQPPDHEPVTDLTNLQSMPPTLETTSTRPHSKPKSSPRAPATIYTRSAAQTV